MASPRSEYRRQYGSLGGRIRSAATKEEADEIRRELAALKIAEHIEATVAKFPPLTDEQRSRITALLAGEPKP